MKFVSTAWIPGTLAQFESSQCLSIHAEQGLATAEHPLTVYILEGFSKLSDDYLGRLATHHILAQDAESIFRSVKKEFLPLQAYLGDGPGAGYELACFLRWVVIEAALDGEPFVHMDLDLFFQEDFDTIGNLFAGCTGTFGSPCLTIVSDYSWLANYRAALQRLVSDPVSFQAEIKFDGNEFRNRIGSDQDLVVQLERQQMLPSRGLDEIWDSHAVFINPLYPDRYGPTSVPHSLSSREGQDWIDEKSVLFWHLQNNFADYLARFAVLEQAESGGLKSPAVVRLNLPFIELEPSAENYAFYALRDLCMRNIEMNMNEDGSIDFSNLTIERYFSRSWITRWFVLSREGRNLFSAEYWWQENVFRPLAPDTEIR